MAKRPDTGKVTHDDYLKYITDMPLTPARVPEMPAASPKPGKGGSAGLSADPAQNMSMDEFFNRGNAALQAQPQEAEQPPKASAWDTLKQDAAKLSSPDASMGDVVDTVRHAASFANPYAAAAESMYAHRDAIKQGAATSEGARWGAEAAQNLMEHDFGNSPGTTGTKLANLFPGAYAALKKYNAGFDEQAKQAEAEIQQQLKDNPNRNELMARWDQMVGGIAQDFENNPTDASYRLLTNVALNPGFVAGMLTPIPGAGAARAASAGRGAYMAARVAAEAAKDAGLATAQRAVTNEITGVEGSAGQYGFDIGLNAAPAVALKGVGTAAGAAIGKESGYMHGYSDARNNAPGTVETPPEVDAVLRGAQPTPEGVDPNTPTPLRELLKKPNRAQQQMMSEAMLQRGRPMLPEGVTAAEQTAAPHRAQAMRGQPMNPEWGQPKPQTAIEPNVPAYRTTPEVPEYSNLESLGKWAQDAGDEAHAVSQGMSYTPQYGLRGAPEEAPIPAARGGYADTPVNADTGAFGAQTMQEGIRRNLTNPRTALKTLEDMPVNTRRHWAQDPEVARSIDTAVKDNLDRLSTLKEQALKAEDTGDWAKYMEARKQHEAATRGIQTEPPKVTAPKVEAPTTKLDTPATKATKQPKIKQESTAKPEPRAEATPVAKPGAKPEATAPKAKAGRIKTDYAQRSIFGDESGKADTDFVKFLAGMGIGSAAAVATVGALQDNPDLMDKLIAAATGGVAGAVIAARGGKAVRAAGAAAREMVWEPAKAATKAGAEEIAGVAKDAKTKRADVGGTPQRRPVGAAIDAARKTMADAVERDPGDSWLGTKNMVPAAGGLAAAGALNYFAQDKGNVPDNKQWMSQSALHAKGYRLPSSGISFPAFVGVMALSAIGIKKGLGHLASVDIPASLKEKRWSLVTDRNRVESGMALMGTRVGSGLVRDLPKVQDRLLLPFFVEEKGRLNMNRVPEIIQRWFKEESGFDLTQDYLNQNAAAINKASEPVREFYATAGQKALEAGVVKGLLDDYISHSWKYPEANREKVQAYLDNLVDSEIMQGGRSKFAAHRVMNKMYHALEDEKLKALGLEPKHRDTVALISEYANSMGKNIADKRMLNMMTDMKLDDGNPLAVLKTKVYGNTYANMIADAKKTVDEKYTEWKMMRETGSPEAIADAHRQLKAARKEHYNLKEEAKRSSHRDVGELLRANYQQFPNHRMLNGYVFHPDVVDMVNGIFSPRADNFIDRIGFLSNAVKRLQVAFSLFHAWSLATVSAATRGGSGIVGSFVNLPRAGYETGKGIVDMLRGKYDPLLMLHDLGNADISHLRKLFPKLNDTQIKEKHAFLRANAPHITRFVEEGLVLGDRAMDWKSPEVDNLARTIDTKAREVFGDKLGSLMSALPRGADAVMKQFDRITWPLIHDGFKIDAAMRAFDQIKKSNPTIPDDVAYQQAAKFANFQFGGLNWAMLAEQMTNKMGRSMMYSLANTRGRNIAGIALFAPDWLVSTTGAALHALPNKATPKEAAALYRMVQLRGWMWWATAVQIASMMTTGHPTWDNKRDMLRIEQPLEGGMRLEYNPLKHFGEIYHAGTDLIGFSGNKLAAIPKMTGELLGGHKFGTNIPISKEEGTRAIPDYVQHFVKSVSPIASSTVTDERLNTTQKLGATIASIAGIAPHVVNPKKDPKDQSKGILTSILKELGAQ